MEAREEIEAALGRKMHEIGIQQEIVAGNQKLLQKLHSEANEFDQQLKDLDTKDVG